MLVVSLLSDVIGFSSLPSKKKQETKYQHDFQVPGGVLIALTRAESILLLSALY